MVLLRDMKVESVKMVTQNGLIMSHASRCQNFEVQTFHWKLLRSEEQPGALYDKYMGPRTQDVSDFLKNLGNQ